MYAYLACSLIGIIILCVVLTRRVWGCCGDKQLCPSRSHTLVSGIVINQEFSAKVTVLRLCRVLAVLNLHEPLRQVRVDLPVLAEDYRVVTWI